MTNLKRLILLVLSFSLVLGNFMPVLRAESATVIVLKVGSKSEAVKQVQTRLKQLGYFVGPITGYYGTQTRAAVLRWQKANGLPADGIIGPVSWNRLFNVSVTRGTTATAQRIYLTLGSRGEQVKRLQQKLNQLGFYQGPITGYFGTLTRTAVVKWQKSRGLAATGVVNQQAWTALMASQNPVSRGVTATRPAVLGLGVRSNLVLELQQSLKTMGLLTVQPTGYYGLLTVMAVQAWEKANGLKVDGIVVEEELNKIRTQAKALTNLLGGAEKGAWILGYTAIDYPGDNRSAQSVVQSQGLGAIATFTYTFDNNGNLKGNADQEAYTLQQARARGIKPLALLHNFDYRAGFDKNLARAVLTDPAKRQRLISQLVNEVQNRGYLGVNLDVEGIYPADAPHYLAFLGELKQQLGAKGLLTVVSIPAKTRDDTTSSWSGGYDYAAIGQRADLVQIMTYDEHWIGGPAGPIASYPWTEQVVKYAVSKMPASKILLGLATYGYDWVGTGARSVTYPQAVARAAQYGVKVNWDATALESWFTYTDEQGQKHEVWFENVESNARRLVLVKQYGLAGAGIWRLGFEDSAYWQMVQQYLQQ
ncbi:peptidoglycan-binding protein [Carboxydocella sp. ULO1]|uniref:peptidoglycan-binding protein n=1 Tax=Carboxydocella sp. ULO1 TaxID=1926599 RepID=UPI0009AED45C|nr:peptidoglycan-binding protein [Carboxydocella sp. ULO1]GAW27440.1 hypothetical protein ULO1_00100 [Carboxydocella sp. ULO1]